MFRVGEPPDIDFRFNPEDGEIITSATAAAAAAGAGAGDAPLVTLEMVVQQLQETAAKLRVAERLLQKQRKVAASAMSAKGDQSLQMAETMEAEKEALRASVDHVERRLKTAEREIVDLRKQVKAYKDKEKEAEGKKKSRMCVVS